MPVFLDYYVSHDNINGAMYFAPQKEGSKPAIEAGSKPTQLLPLAYLRQNIENGERYVQLISVGVGITALIVWSGIIILAFIQKSETILRLLGVGSLGYVVISVCYLVLRWALDLIFLPGDIVAPVMPADEAIAKINATHMTVFGLLSFAAYKIFGKKQQDTTQSN